ncbi:MAG TPA: thymidine kinase [Caldithrix abyssi]|uniref:Thymidine kinase n=1 Tax=Caldithrix abyssi TaxID=187145 RepID=A0A7V4U2E1_CALAY|nr:thymidine kinase [Caldithrix abyssi]
MMHVVKQHTGWIEVICGSMFSGKTEELIRRLRRALIARQRVAIFKPKLDNRYSKEELVSHSQQKIESIPIEHPEEILKHALEAQVVGIDEAQFFDDSIVGICQTLANMGKRVIVAGLDQDYRGKPFGPMPQLLAIAEYIDKTHAICVICGNPANYTYRKTADKDTVVVGAADVYEARCRNCFVPPREDEQKEQKKG